MRKRSASHECVMGYGKQSGEPRFSIAQFWAM